MADDPQTDGGRDRPAATAQEPVTLTEEEVVVMAGRRAKATPIVRRLVAHHPAGATGRLVTDRATPPRITAEEMASIRRARRSTIAVRARFDASEVPAELVTEPRDGKYRPRRSPGEVGEA